ncbi:hypothetical protein GJ496_002600 [Pomphorhynchus laevis]|nr:hypothetical protein GJ496_002600 [Pomphorhynchus laevis]
MPSQDPKVRWTSGQGSEIISLSFDRSKSERVNNISFDNQGDRLINEQRDIGALSTENAMNMSNEWELLPDDCFVLDTTTILQEDAIDNVEMDDISQTNTCNDDYTATITQQSANANFVAQITLINYKNSFVF